MRDYVTKAMRQLFVARLPVLSQLIVSFAGASDPYVSERLAVIGHGAVLTAGTEDPDGALQLARTLRDSILAHEEIPNVLTRDAVRGCFEWLLREGLIDEAEYEAVLPPYGSTPPGKPRTRAQLERAYERRRKGTTGNYVPSPYGALFFSLFSMGDFGRYVAESQLHHFSTVKLQKPYPSPRPAHPPTSTYEPDLQALLDGLSSAGGEPLRSEPEVRRRPRRQPGRRYPGELARRWIFERVLELGWTPERFDEFERTYLLRTAACSGPSAARSVGPTWRHVLVLLDLLASV
jgi:hypothetical protein